MAVPVELRQGGEWGGRPAPAAAAALLLQLLSKDPRAVGRTISPRLKLDSRSRLSRRLRSPRQRGDRWLLTLKDYRSINKALSMELLCASLLAHLNSAESVVSLCCSDEGTPYNFAPAGLPDLTAEYAPDIRLVAEVSAKADAGLEFQQGQLEQALRHANDEQDKSPEPQLIYAWVINNGDVGSDPALRLQYQEFVRKNGLLEEGCRIRVAPMHTRDAAFALALLCSKPPTGGFGFPSCWLADALECMADELMKDAAPEPQGWMADLFARSVGDQGSLLPPEPPSDDDDGPPGMR